MFILLLNLTLKDPTTYWTVALYCVCAVKLKPGLGVGLTVVVVYLTLN